MNLCATSQPFATWGVRWFARRRWLLRFLVSPTHFAPACRWVCNGVHRHWFIRFLSVYAHHQISESLPAGAFLGGNLEHLGPHGGLRELRPGSWTTQMLISCNNVRSPPLIDCSHKLGIYRHYSLHCTYWSYCLCLVDYVSYIASPMITHNWCWCGKPCQSIRSNDTKVWTLFLLIFLPFGNQT